MHVDHGELLLSVGGKQLLDLVGRETGDVGVETDEGGEECDGRGGQVHDVV